MQPAAGPRKPRIQRQWLIAAALAGLAAVVFFPALDCEFVNLDDPDYVTNNPQVKAGLTAGGASWAFTTTAFGNWHPLTWLSLQTDATLWRNKDGKTLRPVGFHLTNLVLHAGSGALLFLALRALTGATWRSAAVAALFAVHPLRAESVAWVAERKDVLSTFFGMAALLAYAEYVRRPSAVRYAAILVTFAVSLLAKQMLVTLPCLLLVLDWWPLRRVGDGGAESSPPTGPTPVARRMPGTAVAATPSWKSSAREKVGAKAALTDVRTTVPLMTGLSDPTESAARVPGGQTRIWLRRVVEKIPIFALTGVSAVVTYIAQSGAGATQGLETFPLTARLENAAISYVSYVGKTYCPVNLAVFYPHRYYPWGAGLPLMTVAGSILSVVAVTAGAVVLMRRAPYLLAGWLWYLGTLVPVIGVLQVGDQAYADRYSYFPQIGLLIATCWGVADLARRVPRLAVTAAIAAVLVLSVMTREQLTVWHDSIALWENDLRAAGPNPLCLTDLGIALEEKGRRAEAEDHLRDALALESRAPLTHINLANLLSRQGRLDEAIKEFEIACELRPWAANPLTQLSEVYLHKHDPEKAALLNEKALELDPELSGAYCNQGLIEIARGHFDEAGAAFREALRLQPDFPEAHCGLGNVLLHEGDKENGLAELREAVQCNPRYGEGHLYLALELEKRGEFRDAGSHYDKAVENTPGLSQAWFGLGKWMIRQQRWEDAVDCLQHAVELDPRSDVYRDYLKKARNLLPPVPGRVQ